MAGDRERFLAGGMDSYLSKPIRSDLLFEVLESYARVAQQRPAEVA
jgi:CheY-like chemotaxis protein